MSVALVMLERWLLFASVEAVAVCGALALHYVLARILGGLAQRSASKVDDLLVDRLRGPARWVLILLALVLAAELFQVPAEVDAFARYAFVRHVFAITLISLVVWLLITLTYVLNDVLLLRYEVDVRDNLQARKVHTQVAVLRRIAIVTVLTIGLATVLMTFPRVRQLGTAILASAGIAGVVLGLAAQKTLGNVIAGLQIAFTQPMRIDDVVIVEGEWGRIEEITLTYVVVRIWDMRRLIVPITYFIDKPFQNWTRVTADILGTVYLYVDYTVPVEDIRAELGRILDSSELWDRKVNGLQVTNVSERTVELRALMSASDAGTAWNLRCHVRERLIAFVQKAYPHALPRVRAELEKSEHQPDNVA